MHSLEDILNADPSTWQNRWQSDIDDVVSSLPTPEQIEVWKQLLERIADDQPKGHPLFRLGILQLQLNADENVGIQYLQDARDEDRRHFPQHFRQMAAHRVVTLLAGYLGWLRELPQKPNNEWLRKQFDCANRGFLLDTIFNVFDMSLCFGPHYGTDDFHGFVADKELCQVAANNYACALHLMELWEMRPRPCLHASDEQALALAVIGMFGGVLEATLLDRMPDGSGKTLGQLIHLAYTKQLVRVGGFVAAVASVILYFRNHVHAERASARGEYPVDMQTAKAIEVALHGALVALDPRVAKSAATGKR